MSCCVKCGKPVEKLMVTAYGDMRCPDCFDDYLMTDRGKVEYFIGLTTDELNLNDYDADFLGHVAVCWKKYRAHLDLTIAEVKLIEAKAKDMGIF